MGAARIPGWLPLRGRRCCLRSLALCGWFRALGGRFSRGSRPHRLNSWLSAESHPSRSARRASGYTVAPSEHSTYVGTLRSGYAYLRRIFHPKRPCHAGTALNFETRCLTSACSRRALNWPSSAIELARVRSCGTEGCVVPPLRPQLMRWSVRQHREPTYGA